MKNFPLDRSALLQFIASALCALVAVILIFRPLLSLNPESTLWADDFDPNLLRWTAEWGFYALGQNFSPDLFWNAQSFYPHANTLTYSDALLTLQILYTPLRWLGVAPLSALYLSLAGFSIAGFMLSVYLLGKVGSFTLIERLIIAYAAHFSLCVLNFLPHYQLFGFHLAPPFFISLYLFARSMGLRWLTLALLLFCLGVSFAIYLAPMLFACGLVVGMIGLAEAVSRLGIRAVAGRILPATAIAILFAAALYLVLIRHYAEMIKTTPPQSFEESATYSASPLSIFKETSLQSKWYAPAGGNYSQYGDWERAYFPGWLLLAGSALGALGVLAARFFPALKPDRNFYLCAGALGAFALVLSWGPFFHGSKLPFYYLADLLPGLRSIRAPGRFGIFLGLALGALLVAGLRALPALFRSKLFGRSLQFGALLLLITESIPSFRTFEYQEPFRERYQKLAEMIQPQTPLAEFPSHGASHFDTIKVIMMQLNGALYHRGRIALGYGGRSTEECQTLINFDQRFVAGEIDFGQLLEYLDKLKIKSLLVHLDRYKDDRAAQISELVLRQHNFSTRFRNNAYLIATKRVDAAQP